ncbi:MAG: ABC transporter permease [Chloroflexi bacterium]|nr:ABC transporter permease [Chloroflexota bacterium]MCI0575526.1 ABC transporter permease [Chloroflexota bacterium]MCI0644303.1 ABC transporter permease [Chloroflexota bacterium]MCI0726286.1 ABC transporter permease [Chloroflexota bacterium]
MTDSLTHHPAEVARSSNRMTSLSRPSWQVARPVRRALSFVLMLLLLALVWEGMKWLGGNPWRPDANPLGIEHDPPYRWKVASDLNLPHLWDIGRAFSEPARRNGPPLVNLLAGAALFTFREAITGFLFGALLGLLLGTIFAHSGLLERGLMPYVVASQTVPILAIAPMVIIWLKAGWVSVAVISAYLTFFPVTINTLRGLRSADPVALELMRSYAASRWQTLWKLRFPAALPYIFTALKVSATASVVGAIIGELPSGIRDGLGGAILNFNQYYISGPSKLWAAIVATAVIGIAFFVIITLLEAVVVRGRREEE